MERRAGFEPATPRLSDEVTAIFTTDRERVGGERSMLLPPSGELPFHEVTDIFTTAMPRALLRLGNREARWGTSEIGITTIETQVRL
jgi:hypothetical protein